ncbi:hypothetical protein [Secundilactobacillus muriivasis]
MADNWTANELQKLATQEPHFQDRALLTALAALAKEQQRRIDLASGELDGRMWNPSQW